MNSEIQPLSKEKWQGYQIPMQYETSHFYDVEITTGTDAFSASFVKKPLDRYLHQSLGDSAIFRTDCTRNGGMARRHMAL